jgi:hypothetical protein
MDMTDPLPSIEVVLCDDEKAQHASLRESLSGIFAGAGFAPNFTILDSVETLDQVLKRRPHIVVMDNVFGNEENLGVSSISIAKSQYPELPFILMTGATFSVAQLGIRLPNPDFIITKSHLKSERYQMYLALQMAPLIKRYPVKAIVTDEASNYTVHNSTLEESELRVLIEQIIFSGRLIEERESPQVQLRKLSGGLSGALALEMKIQSKSKTTFLPTVVKIAPKDWIAAELEAFRTFVRWQLPHTLRVDVIGSAETKQFGAICYAFVLANEPRVQSATYFLRKGNSKIVSKIIKDIYQATSRGWYSPILGSQEISAHLANRREFDAERDPKRDEALVSSARVVAKEDGLQFTPFDGGMRIGTVEIPPIRRAIFLTNWGPLVECFGHGDLNANNIMVNSNVSRLALIDFADSGRNPAFRDFVSLETSVRLEWDIESSNEDPSFEISYEQEARLFEDASAGARIGGYLEKVAQIRLVAIETFPNVPFAHYAALLALNLWKVNAVRPPDLKSQRRLLAAIAASLTYLDRERLKTL